MRVPECDHLSDQVQVERRKLIVDLVRGELSLVEVDYREDADPVARQGSGSRNGVCYGRRIRSRPGQAPFA
jgi:hypothetical protein